MPSPFAEYMIAAAQAQATLAELFAVARKYEAALAAKGTAFQAWLASQEQRLADPSPGLAATLKAEVEAIRPTLHLADFALATVAGALLGEKVNRMTTPTVN